MRNSIPGTVTRTSRSNHSNEILVWVDIGVELCAKITMATYKDMSIHIDDKLYVSFKATSAKVF